MIIRREYPGDYKEVYDMVKRSFATTTFSDGTEADYLQNLRSKDCFIPKLSLVATDEKSIVGQIVLYRMQIDCGSRTEEQLVISPLSVHPEHFRKGIGKTLIEEGCRRGAALGYKAVFLCGDFDYYSQFGFVPTFQHGIFHINDSEKTAKWCMVRELEEGFLDNVKGIVEIE